MRRRPIGLIVLLLLAAGLQAAGFVAVWRVFVLSEYGQMLDTAALAGNVIGQSRVDGLVGSVLDAISAASVLVATGAVGFLALIRRRVAAAIGAVLLIVGANLTTQLAKLLIVRPDLGIDPERAGAGNSLPSGHTTVAAAVAVAAVLVAPTRLRGTAAVLGAAFTALVGVATLSAGWHRPSDAVAATLNVGVWACLAAVFIVVAQRRTGAVEYGPPSRLAMQLLVLAGVVLLVLAGLGLLATDQVVPTPPEELSRRRLLAAYAGGAAGIAGTASLMLAGVLAAARRVVPQSVSAPAVDQADEPAPVAG